MAAPVVHVWYLRGRPSYLATMLNLSKKRCEALAYCIEHRGFDLFSIPNNGIPKSQEAFGRFQPCLFKFYRRSHRFAPLGRPSFFKSRQKILTEWSYLNTISTFLNLSKRKFNGEGRLFPNIQKDFSLRQFNYQDPSARLATLKVFYPRGLGKPHRVKKLKVRSIHEWPIYQPPKTPIRQLGWLCVSQFIQWESPRQWLYFRQYITTNPGNWYGQNVVYYRKGQRGNLEGTGAQTMYFYLNELNQSRSVDSSINTGPQLLERQIRIALVEDWKNPLNPSLHAARLKRLKLLRCFRRSPNAPVWMLLTVLPVLPPDLRPIVKLDHEQVAIADLNKLYQKVIVRSRRLERLLFNRYFKHSDECAYSQRLLQEAVDALIENGKGGATPMCTVTRRPLKSLSDMLKGKKGRFRQNLLGKRVDYSGRSVIVVAPSLRVHECGLPRDMAIELFQPFLVRRLLLRRLCRTVLGARRMIQKRSTVIWTVLREVLSDHPVLLNRAPTLHRLSIQAFCPKLVGGRAILLHPLVCSAFNADFDGDQMAVHIPLSFEARAEAWKLAWSCNNILSLASGDAILSPSQDMVIGCYFLTTSGKQTSKPVPYSSSELRFSKLENSSSLKLEINGLDNRPINPQQFLWIPWYRPVEFDEPYQLLLEIRCARKRKIRKLYPSMQRDFNDQSLCNQKIFTTVGRVLLHQLIRGVQQTV